MVKVKFKIRHDDVLFFGRYSYIEVIQPQIEITDRHIIVRGPNFEVAAVIPSTDSLIFVSAKIVNGNSSN